jgi:predicted DsbA family dithiol-disulfide isomerase
MDAGVRDTVAFRSCLGSAWAHQRLDEDSVAAARLALSSTPTLIIRNEAISGSIPLDSLESWIRRVAPGVLGK